MSNGDDVDLIAPCGLYCGACPVFRAASDEALAKRIAETLGLPMERVKCRGCRGEQGHIPFMGEPRCPTYECIEGRGLRYCYECADFPCLKLAPCADKAQMLPHNTKVYSLAMLRKLGTDEFIKQGRQLWSQYFSGKKERGGDELQV